jgi:hypothetical protein
MRTESFLISTPMTHQGYPLSVKLNDFQKKRLLVHPTDQPNNQPTDPIQQTEHN